LAAIELDPAAKDSTTKFKTGIDAFPGRSAARRTKSAFTRVFDALWRRGAAAEPGS
jgi:hypothetical protein